MGNCEITAIQEEINKLQCRLDTIKKQPCNEYQNKPNELDTYCDRVEVTDRHIYVVIGRCGDAWVSNFDLKSIASKLGKTFVGINNNGYGIEKICIEKGQFVLVFDNTC